MGDSSSIKRFADLELEAAVKGEGLNTQNASDNWGFKQASSPLPTCSQAGFGCVVVVPPTTDGPQSVKQGDQKMLSIAGM